MALDVFFLQIFNSKCRELSCKNFHAFSKACYFHSTAVGTGNTLIYTLHMDTLSSIPFSRFPCHERCGKMYKTKEELMLHRKSVKDKYKDHRCIACAKSFETEDTLQQHITSKAHNVKGSTMKAPNAYMNLLLKELVVDKEDRKQSKGIKKDIVTKIMENVRGQQGGKIYSADVRKAGSSAVKAKIGKADEFDLNIPMYVKVEGIRTQGTLTYSYDERIPKGKKVCYDTIVITRKTFLNLGYNFATSVYRKSHTTNAQ